MEKSNNKDVVQKDIVIYGGTSAGIIAGIQAIESGKSVVVIEPGNREGGLTTGGLGQTDIGNKNAIGGLSREFYRRIAAYYKNEDSWKWQKRSEYKGKGQSKTEEGEDTLWTFEPSAALNVFRQWIKEKGLRIDFGERLDRKNGVIKEGSKIISIKMESGKTYAGKVYLDCTYEGDLMAAAGVSYAVGREANEVYSETLNGVQSRYAYFHQIMPGVSPFIVAGDNTSGLLPFIEPAEPNADGSGDKKIQAYCFRMCLTDHPENKIPFEKPDGYDENWYELMLRNFEAGERIIPWINSPMPNRKTDTNNKGGFSTDFIGQNYDYPEADYKRRKEIINKHIAYQKGLMWTLANNSRVPEAIRSEVARWGLPKDEFVETGGWSSQIYVREARRMVSDVVINQNHVEAKITADDSVGLAAYGMDSHNTVRYVNAAGHVRNEGDVEVGGFEPYPISYLAIVPKRDECANLLVPVCLSASHIAFGSIRMEPVFMVLAQSAAIAASIAIDQNLKVQELQYSLLKTKLKDNGQRLR